MFGAENAAVSWSLPEKHWGHVNRWTSFVQIACVFQKSSRLQSNKICSHHETSAVRGSMFPRTCNSQVRGEARTGTLSEPDVSEPLTEMGAIRNRV